MRHLRMGNAIQWNHLKPSLATSATSDTVVEALTMLITDVKANCSLSDCYRGSDFSSICYAGLNWVQATYFILTLFF